LSSSAFLSLSFDSLSDGKSLQALVDSSVKLAAGNSNESNVPVWKPDSSTSSFLKKQANPRSDQLGNNVLLWSGTFGSSCVGSNVPAVKARGFIRGRSARSVATLLMDSSRVKEYNSLSLGRTDLRVLQKGLSTNSKQHGVGETKIVRNRTKPPLTSKVLTFTTLMHARELKDGTIVVVSRAVNDPSATPGDIKSEILLGVNILKPISDDSCEITSVTHVTSPLVPAAFAKTMGSKGARDFITGLSKK
jgi:hypothetical protein